MFHIIPQLILPTNLSLVQLDYCLGGHLFDEHDRNISIATTTPLLPIMVAQALIVSFALLLLSTVPLLVSFYLLLMSTVPLLVSFYL